MKKSSKIILAGTLYFTLLFSAVTVKAEHFSGGFASGKLTVGAGGSSSVSITKTALSQWNNVSSKVSLTYTTATDTYGSSANIVTYFDTSNPPTAGLLGEMIPYKSWTGTSASVGSTSDRWVKAVVYQYKNSSLDTTTKKTATATHEIGHALSVAHPSSSNTTAVMRQGVKTSYSLTSYDKDSLKNKWGK